MISGDHAQKVCRFCHILGAIYRAQECPERAAARRKNYLNFKATWPGTIGEGRFPPRQVCRADVTCRVSTARYSTTSSEARTERRDRRVGGWTGSVFIAGFRIFVRRAERNPCRHSPHDRHAGHAVANGADIVQLPVWRDIRLLKKGIDAGDAGLHEPRRHGVETDRFRAKISSVVFSPGGKTRCTQRNRSNYFGKRSKSSSHRYFHGVKKAGRE